MEIIKLKDDHIKLGQALKLASLVEDGVVEKITPAGVWLRRKEVESV